MDGADGAQPDAGVHALAMSLFACMSITIGAVGAFFVRPNDKTILSITLSISSGVMLFVSLHSILQESVESFDKSPAVGRASMLLAVIFFVVGMGAMFVLDQVVHALMGGHGHGDGDHDDDDSSVSEGDNPINLDSEPWSRWSIPSLRSVRTDSDVESTDGAAHTASASAGMDVASIVTLCAIALHNIPEGMSCYIAVFRDPAAGIVIPLAMAIHNLPAGLCVAMPILFSTGSKVRAVGYAALCGALGFLGALIAFALPAEIFTEFFFGVAMGATAGMLVFVAMFELLVKARKNDPKDRVTTKSTVLGLFIMATALVILKFIEPATEQQ